MNGASGFRFLLVDGVVWLAGLNLHGIALTVTNAIQSP